MADGPLARNLRRLIASSRPLDAAHWGYTDVTRAINDYYGREVIKWRYLHALATGTKAQPNLELLKLLAAFFRVSLDELVGDRPAEPYDEESLVRAALANAGLRQMIVMLQETPRSYWPIIRDVIALARQTLDMQETAVGEAASRSSVAQSDAHSGPESTPASGDASAMNDGAAAGSLAGEQRV